MSKPTSVLTEHCTGCFLNSDRNSKTGWKRKKKKEKFAKQNERRISNRFGKKIKIVSTILISLNIFIQKNLVNYPCRRIARSILWLEIYFFLYFWRRFLTRSMCSSTSVRFASREYVIMIGINFPFLREGSSLVPHRSQWRRFVPRGCDSSTFVSSNLILVTFQMHFERM